MDYFHYTYKHNHIDFNSDIYKVSTYHYNWHSGVEVLILLKGRIDMSCNSEVFTMEPLDTIIISPQVGHATLALEEDTTALVIHVGKDFFQQFDSNFGMYQFVLRSDESNRYNSFFTTLRHHAAMMMLLMVNGESPTNRLDVEYHYLSLVSDIYKEINKVKSIHVHTKPVDITVATFDKMIAYIDENYQQKIELENLAKIGGYNVNYTSQFFKRQLGVSFLEYVLRLRLREATVRLVNSNDAVAHIASSCGFADIKAFNVALKKHFHTTPSEYRKQANEIGRKTKLHDWKEIISTQEQDIIEILQSCLPYQDDSTNKIRLEVANQKLNDVREQLEMVVKNYKINWYCYIPL
ncbi:MAG: helix-turn-helix domain-containing protein [Veillonella parvula]|jgi:AraC-like DNA-binding protein|uniref:AraC family transcriptional regulator n=1 Tax=Veillonella parvula TaxID=29466 RepID=UPI00241F081B|nr:AraC family transcriptional regulator [Veillonella parvula]